MSTEERSTFRMWSLAVNYLRCTPETFLSDMSPTLLSPYPPRRSHMSTTPQEEPVPQYWGGMPAVFR